jgi:phage repressor protein C with HTH and peptisase S24 domain
MHEGENREIKRKREAEAKVEAERLAKEEKEERERNRRREEEKTEKGEREEKERREREMREQEEKKVYQIRSFFFFARCEVSEIAGAREGRRSLERDRSSDVPHGLVGQLSGPAHPPRATTGAEGRREFDSKVH